MGACMSNDVVEPQTINPTSTMPQQHQVKPKLTPHIPPVEDEEPEAQDEDEEEAAADEEEDNEENEAEEEADEEDNEEDEGEDETNAIFKNGDLIGLRVGVNGRYLSCDEQGSVVGSKELFEFTVVLEDDSEIRYGTKISLLSQNTGKFLCAEESGEIVCDRDENLEWETFMLCNAEDYADGGIIEEGAAIALETYHATYLSISKKGRVIASSNYGDNELFFIEKSEAEENEEVDEEALQEEQNKRKQEKKERRKERKKARKQETERQKQEREVQKKKQIDENKKKEAEKAQVEKQRQEEQGKREEEQKRAAEKLKAEEQQREEQKKKDAEQKRLNDQKQEEAKKKEAEKQRQDLEKKQQEEAKQKQEAEQRKRAEEQKQAAEKLKAEELHREEQKKKEEQKRLNDQKQEEAKKKEAEKLKEAEQKRVEEEDAKRKQQLKEAEEKSRKEAEARKASEEKQRKEAEEKKRIEDIQTKEAAERRLALEKKEAEAKRLADEKRQREAEAKRAAKQTLPSTGRSIKSEFVSKPANQTDVTATSNWDKPHFLLQVANHTELKVTQTRKSAACPAYFTLCKFNASDTTEDIIRSDYTYATTITVTQTMEAGLYAIKNVETLVDNNEHSGDFTITLHSSNGGVAVYQGVSDAELSTQYNHAIGNVHDIEQKGVWTDDKGIYFAITTLEKANMTIVLQKSGYERPALFHVQKYKAGRFETLKTGPYSYATTLVLKDVEMEPGTYFIDCHETAIDGKPHSKTMSIHAFAKTPFALSKCMSEAEAKDTALKSLGYIHSVSIHGKHVDDGADTSSCFILGSTEPTSMIVMYTRDSDGTSQQITYLELKRMLQQIKQEYSWGKENVLEEHIEADSYGIFCSEKKNSGNDSFTLTVHSSSPVTLSEPMTKTKYIDLQTKLYDSKDTHWKDPDFVPGPATIGSPKAADQADIQKSVQSWLRPKEIRGTKNPKLFVDGADKNDVHQGIIGDCYLISIFSILTEHTEIIKKVFVSTEEEMANGKYGVRLYVQGGWKTIYVDDRIPCGSDGSPVFARATDPDELWVSLLEKVFAKMGGSYISIWAGNEGSMCSPFEMLTGGHNTNTFTPANNQESWKELYKMFSNQNQASSHMATVSAHATRREEFKTVGLVAHHAYSIVNCVELQNGTIKLVQLRNPWGRHEFTGKWSDKDSSWTPDLLRELGTKLEKKHEDADDGCFFMSYEDFCFYWLPFSSIRVTSKEKDWNRTIVTSDWSDSSDKFILFELADENQVMITATQSQEQYVCLEKKPLLSTHSLTLKRCKDGLYDEEVAHYSTCDIHYFIDRKLPKGKYAIQMSSKESPYKGFTVNVCLKNPGTVSTSALVEEELFRRNGYGYCQRKKGTLRINNDRTAFALTVMEQSNVQIFLRKKTSTVPIQLCVRNAKDPKCVANSEYSYKNEFTVRLEATQKGFYKISPYHPDQIDSKPDIEVIVYSSGKIDLSNCITEPDFNELFAKYGGFVNKIITPSSFQNKTDKPAFELVVEKDTTVEMVMQRSPSPNPAYFWIYGGSVSKSSEYTYGEVIRMETLDIGAGTYSVFATETGDAKASGPFKLVVYSKLPVTLKPK